MVENRTVGSPSDDERLVGKSRRADVPHSVASLCRALAPVINEFVERSVQESLCGLSERVRALETRL